MRIRTTTTPRFIAIALTAQHLAAMPSTRLLKFTLGWTITLYGMFLLMVDLGAAATPLLHDVAAAIGRAIA